MGGGGFVSIFLWWKILWDFAIKILMKWNILQALVHQVQKDHDKCHKCGAVLHKENFFVDDLLKNKASFTQACHVCDTEMFIQTEINVPEQSQKPLKSKALDTRIVDDLAKDLSKITRVDLKQQLKNK